MARYRTTDIKIEGTRKHAFRNKLNTIAHRKLENIKNLVPFVNGKYVYRLESTLQRGKIISYSDGGLWVAKFQYITKKLVGNGYRNITQWMYISYEELIEFEREMEINEVLGEKTELISHYKNKTKPKLELPSEVEVGDVLRYRNYTGVLVTRVTPRTFLYRNIFFTDTMEIDEIYGDERRARIKDLGYGPVWVTECDRVVHKIE